MTQIKTTVRRRAGTPPPKTVTPPKTTPSIVGRPPGTVKRLIGLLFGPPKTGKTTGGASGTTVESGEQTLMISFDPDGDLAETLIGRTDIVVITPTIDEMDGIIKALYTTDAGRFKVVLLDSITFLFQAAGGKEIYKTYKDNKDVRRAYGKAGAITAQIISDLVNIPAPTSVIFTAHLKHANEDEAKKLDAGLGENEVQVAVSPMVWAVLGPAVSFIGRTYRQTTWEDEIVGGKKKRNKKTAFRVSLNDGERSPAGSRLPMAADYEVTPTWLSELADTLIKGGE